MNRTHLVRIPITNVYEIEIVAPDDEHIFNHEDPKFARYISKEDLDKLRHPEWYKSPVERISKIESVLEPINFCDESLEKEIFTHA